MTSILSDGQRAGLRNMRAMNIAEGRVELDFRTLPLQDFSSGFPQLANSRGGTDDGRNIDNLLQLQIRNLVNWNRLGILLWGGAFGTDRYVTVYETGFNMGNATNDTPSQADSVWQYESDYRFVVDLGNNSTRLSFRDSNNNEVFGHTYAIGAVADIGSFQIDLLQGMGGPNDVEYTDVAIDRLVVKAVVPELRGDYNGDGIVEAADYIVWRNALNRMVPIGTSADGNFDGHVTTADYDVWRSHFGATTAATSAPPNLSVPEPATTWTSAVLLLFALLSPRGLAPKHLRS
jgi:hypothetical protein